MNGKYVALFVAIEAGRNEHPDLVEHDGRSHEQAGEGRHLQVKVEGFGGVQIDQLLGHPVAVQGVHDGALHEAEDELVVVPAGEEAYGDGNDGIDEAAAQFLEVVEEAHGGKAVVGVVGGGSSAAISGIGGLRIWWRVHVRGWKLNQFSSSDSADWSVAWGENLGSRFLFEIRDFSFDLRFEFIGGTLEFVERAADLPPDLRELSRAKDDQSQDEQEDHLRHTEIHTFMIMRARRSGKRRD